MMTMGSWGFFIMGTYVAVQFLGYSGWDDTDLVSTALTGANTTLSMNTTAFSVGSFSFTMVRLSCPSFAQYVALASTRLSHSQTKGPHRSLQRLFP